MLAKLYHGLAMLCIVVTLSLLGLAAWMAATGKFSADNRERLGRFLRDETPLQEVQVTASRPATTRPAAAPSAGTELTMSEEAVERTRLLSRRALAEVDYKRRQLEHLRAEIEREREELAKLRVAFAEEIEARRRRTSDEGFQRQLKVYETMQPKQAKDILVGLPEDLAARYLAEMKPQVAADVMGRFRTPEEQAKLQRLLALMRES
ncbi:MAG: hypothetical protein ACOC95_05680 [Planctomycetota bacterium]